MIKLQQFKQRTLRPVKSNRIPSNFLFMDTETKAFSDHKGESQRFHLGWTCLWQRTGEGEKDRYAWRYFSNEARLNKYISLTAQQLGEIMLVGHNIFFDLQASGFFDYFTRWGWQLDFYYDKGLTYIIRCNLKGSKLTVVSSTNWFDQGLRELGEKLGLEKGKVDFDTVTSRELKAYCRRDVEILIRAMQYYIDFVITNNLGRLCLTKASQAFTAYRHSFMTHRIYLHSDQRVIDLERAAYLGGRVEAFFIGEVSGGPFASMDVNSMYPYVMKKFEYPFKLVEYQEHDSLHRYYDVLKSHAVIAEIEVDTPEPAFAVRYHGKTIFPVGRFTCFVCSQGLEYALKRNYVIRIVRSAIYQRADLFTGYVDYIYSLRKKYSAEGNKIMELLCKYMGNGLYGKFGQKEIVSDIMDTVTGRRYFREEIIDMVNGGVVIQTYLMNKLIIQYSLGEGKNSFVGLAAHITENARFVLWDIMKQTGRNRILYCDTDSVKVREKDVKYIPTAINPDILGAMKCEQESNRLIIGGAKNYRTETSRHIKGIPQEAKEIYPGVFEYPAFHRQVSHLRDGQITGSRVEKTVRCLKTRYDKGGVLDDGRVIPFRF